MGRYFGREPRFTREEIERQAQEAIDARVSLGRPPVEDWEPLEVRMEELDFAIVARRLPEPPSAPPSQTPTQPPSQTPTQPPSQHQPVRRPVVAQPARPARVRRPVPATD